MTTNLFLCMFRVVKVRVIDSIPSIQQPIVHSCIVRRFDNLCFSLRQTMSRQKSGRFERQRVKTGLCFVLFHEITWPSFVTLLVLKRALETCCYESFMGLNNMDFVIYFHWSEMFREEIKDTTQILREKIRLDKILPLPLCGMSSSDILSIIMVDDQGAADPMADEFCSANILTTFISTFRKSVLQFFH